MSQLIFKIDGMDCAQEVALLKGALSPLLKGKEELITFDLINEKMTLETTDGVPTEADVLSAIATTGMKGIPWSTYVTQPKEATTFWQQHGHGVMASISGVSLLAGLITHSATESVGDAFTEDNFPTPSVVLYAVAMAAGWWFILPKAFRSALKLRPDMNVLMTIAAIGAIAIQEWFEGAAVVSLFSASLLLESWNVARARKAIRSLMEGTPLTARVAEEIVSSSVEDQKYLRHAVSPDGDCGYTAFGITREDALQQLIDALDVVKPILQPAIKESLLTEAFYHYLLSNQVIEESVSHEEITAHLDQYADNTAIVRSFLHFDIQDKQVDAGWAHPLILQALAHVQNKEIRMWQLNEASILTPHRGTDYDYALHTPATADAKIDLLFVGGNHFELLEPFSAPGLPEQPTSSSDSPSSAYNITEKPVEEVPVGALIIVRPGEKIPMDSTLVSGWTDVNQAPITGESMPVRKEAGDKLFAGTINGDNAIQCRVTKLASDSTLARIIHMVEDAQSRRAKSEQLIETFSRYYTPLMLLLAVVLATIVPAIVGDWIDWLEKALIILVISCPCALVISTPFSIVAALNTAARAGVLIKGGMYLEAPAYLKAIAFDKTGTLTSGEPVVQSIISPEEHSENELLQLALALEEHSDHPLARAIRREAEAKGIVMAHTVKDFQVIKGKGAQGTIDGKLYWIGSHRFLQEKVGHAGSSVLAEGTQALEASGHSVVAIGHDQHICGVIGIADSVRPESQEAMRALNRVGIRNLFMLTGDNHGTAKVIAEIAGIKNYLAELLPEDKVAQIEALVRQHKQVAMVGDGINDAPAMATASLAIAMGAAGSDVAIETADIALMSDDLGKLAWLIRHSRNTLTIIKENIVFSISVKALFIALAFADKASLWMAILADIGATFLVVANALRLLNNKELTPTAANDDSLPLEAVISSGQPLQVVGGNSRFFSVQREETCVKRTCNGGCSTKGKSGFQGGESALKDDHESTGFQTALGLGGKMSLV